MKNSVEKTEMKKPKPVSEMLSLRVPNPQWEEKQSTVPYLCCINNQKRKKKLKRITLLSVPEVEKPDLKLLLEGLVLDEEKSPSVEGELTSIPTVTRLSLKELEEIKCMMKKKRKKERKGFAK